MKRFAVLGLILVAALLVMFNYKSKNQKPLPTESPLPSFNVKLTLDYGNKNVSNYEVKANSQSTAFSILEQKTKEENIYFETIKYDFGIFVKKIGDFESGAKKSWIYYVNDISGDKAADQYFLKENDSVTWKYETPKY